mgnify:CR=1 FL=1
MIVKVSTDGGSFSVRGEDKNVVSKVKNILSSLAPGTKIVFRIKPRSRRHELAGLVDKYKIRGVKIKISR